MNSVFIINSATFYSISLGTFLCICIVSAIAIASGVIIGTLLSMWVNETDFSDMDNTERKVITISKNIIIASLIMLFICLFIPF